MSNARPGNQDQQHRAAGGAVLRGALLLLIAVVLGAVLLQRGSENKDAGKGKPVSVPDTAVTTTVFDPVIAVPAAGVTPDVTATTALPTAAASVRVLVVNGSGVNRAAARVNEFLSNSGYDRLKPLDAIQTNLDDRITYNEGFKDHALVIASKLGITDFTKVVPTPPIATVKDPVPDFNVQVVVGPFLADRYRTQQLGGVPAAATAGAPAAGGTPDAVTPSSGSKKKKTKTVTTTPKKKKKKVAAATTDDSGTPKATKKPKVAADTPAPTAAPASGGKVPVVTQDPAAGAN
jgi:LytR cell envelope-related transcriptional attenuator